MTDVIIENWRTDIVWPNGEVSKDILFVRVSKDNVEYMAPVFNDDKIDVKEVEKLLTTMVESHDRHSI